MKALSVIEIKIKKGIDIYLKVWYYIAELAETNRKANKDYFLKSKLVETN